MTTNPETPQQEAMTFAAWLDSQRGLLPAGMQSIAESWACAGWKARDAEVESLKAQIVELTIDRDLAIAHDRQPYPTQWAYDQACAALNEHKERLRRIVEYVRRVAKKGYAAAFSLADEEGWAEAYVSEIERIAESSDRKE